MSDNASAVIAFSVLMATICFIVWILFSGIGKSDCPQPEPAIESVLP